MEHPHTVKGDRLRGIGCSPPYINPNRYIRYVLTDFRDLITVKITHKYALRGIVPHLSMRLLTLRASSRHFAYTSAVKTRIAAAAFRFWSRNLQPSYRIYTDDYVMSRSMQEGYVGFSTEVRMSPKPLSHAQVGFEPTFCDKPQFLPLELFER